MRHDATETQPQPALLLTLGDRWSGRTAFPVLQPIANSDIARSYAAFLPSVLGSGRLPTRKGLVMRIKSTGCDSGARLRTRCRGHRSSGRASRTPLPRARRECSAKAAPAADLVDLLVTVVLAVHPATVVLANHRQATSTADLVTAPVDHRKADHHPVISIVVPAIMIGARPAILRTTTGAVDSATLRGATALRRGAGVDHRLQGSEHRCLLLGDRRHPRSTTGVMTSNRFGIRATTSGASTSSGSGFRFWASDRRPGETAASDTPGRSSTFHRSE